MTLELHIWGPAFGLPSIDPQCLATVAYLNRIFDRDQWVLVAAHDPSRSPTGDFPLLLDGATRVAGFRAIVHYLHHHHRYGHWLDTSLSPALRADSLALSTQLISRAQPLLDFLLYGNTENYNTCTRSAFTPILPRIPTYLVPSARRAAAKARIAPLGLATSIAEGNDVLQSPGNPTEQNTSHATQSPSLLFRTPQTLSSLLQQQNATTNIRLAALVSALLDPLQSALDRPSRYEKPYLLPTPDSSTVDCLAFGYLALLIYPPLPDPLFPDTFRKGEKYSKIAAYVHRLRRELLGDGDASVADAFGSNGLHSRAGDARGMLLPWRAPAAPTWSSTAATLLSAALDLSLPPRYSALLTGRVRIPLLADGGESAAARNEKGSIAARRAVDILFPVGFALLGPVAAVFGLFMLSGRDWFGLKSGGYEIGAGDHHFVAERPRPPASLRGMGEAGALLGALGGFGRLNETSEIITGAEG